MITRRAEALIVALVIIGILWAGGAFHDLTGHPGALRTPTTCTYSNADPYAQLSVNSTDPRTATIYVNGKRIGIMPSGPDNMRRAVTVERDKCHGIGED